MSMPDSRTSRICGQESSSQRTGPAQTAWLAVLMTDPP